MSDRRYRDAMIPRTPMRVLRLRLALFVVAACGGPAAPTPPPTPAGPADTRAGRPAATFELIPIPVSTELVVGHNRLLVNLIDNAERAARVRPDRPVDLRFFDLAADHGHAASETEATYMPTIEGRPGLYRAEVDFDRAGEWGLEAITTESDGTQANRSDRLPRPRGQAPRRRSAHLQSRRRRRRQPPPTRSPRSPLTTIPTPTSTAVGG